MAYSPHTWQAGETVTAANMNRIEDGIEECKSDLEDVAMEVTNKTLVIGGTNETE